MNTLIGKIRDLRTQIYLFVVLAIALQVAIWFIAPLQGPVVIYKFSMVTLAAIAGCFLDFCLFPYATPGSYLNDDWRKSPEADRRNEADYPVVDGYMTAFVVALLRRSALVIAFVLGTSLGL